MYQFIKRLLDVKNEGQKPVSFARQSVNMIRREYLGDPLTEQYVKPNPFQQFEVWFEEAVKKVKDDPNAMILSTVDSDGQPSSRTVLLKGFDEDGFLFFTNYESRKGLQISNNPKVSLTFYWPDMLRQICIEGLAEKTASSLSEIYFKSRPAGSRISAIASPQSKMVSSRQELEKMVKKIEKTFDDLDDIPRPPNWGGYKVKPNRVEFWQGRINRLHDRLCYIKEDNDKWDIVRLAP